MSARDEMMKTLVDFTSFPGGVANEILQTLAIAGFRILGPDEVDALREDIQVAINSMTGECEASHRIALNHLDRAFRTLGRKA